MFERAVRETPREYFLTLLEDLEGARQAFEQMNAVLEAKCGHGTDGYSLAPPSSSIRDALAAIEDRVRALAKNHLPAAAQKTTPSDELVPQQRGQETLLDSNGSGGYDREDAFRALLKVADFFHRTEPHSPVAYALEQAVRWGRMSLPELMNDLISDESARHEMFKRLGIAELKKNLDD